MEWGYSSSMMTPGGAASMAPCRQHRGQGQQGSGTGWLLSAPAWLACWRQNQTSILSIKLPYSPGSVHRLGVLQALGGCPAWQSMPGTL